MNNIDSTTGRVLAIDSFLHRAKPSSDSGRERWSELATAPFIKPKRRDDELARLRRLDEVLDRAAIDALDRDLSALPTLQRLFRRLDAERSLFDADFFALKRFFVHSLSLLETADGLDGLPTVDSEIGDSLREAMEVIHPENAPSSRFHLADELDPTLATVRQRLRKTRRRLMERRRELESDIVDTLSGAFDVHGRFRPPEGEEDITDPRLRREQGFYRLDDDELNALQTRRDQLADEVSALEHQQRRRLTDYVEQIIDTITELNEQLVATDVRICRVKLKRRLDGCWPQFVDGDEPWLELRRGRDPALRDALGVDGVQPIDVRFTGRATMVLGPNMGGKSALLRLIGLSQWCAQMALPVPADSCRLSEMRRIVYIGSEQPDHSAATTGLSSFGREIRRFVQFWDSADPVLWLLDEPGRGTHPEEGARLAEKIGQDRVQRGDFVVMATHFPRLAGCEDFDAVRVAGLDVDDSTLEEALSDAADGAESIQRVLGRFMDYQIVDADGAAVPRDAWRVARALGLDLDGETP